MSSQGIKNAVSEVVQSPSWPTLRAALRSRTRRGLEVGNIALPPGASDLVVLCPACEAHYVAVVRTRSGYASARYPERYLSLTCPSALRPGCSRGETSRLAQKMLLEAVDGVDPGFDSLPPDQVGLF